MNLCFVCLCMLFVTDVSGWREDLFRDTQRPLMCPLGIIVNRPQCCQVLTSNHGHIRQKPPAIFEAFTAIYQKIDPSILRHSEN
jgi:hypothetical protein